MSDRTNSTGGPTDAAAQETDRAGTDIGATVTDTADPIDASDRSSGDGDRGNGDRAGDDSRSPVSRRSLLLQATSVGGALGLTQVLDVDRWLDPPGGSVSIETALVHPDPGGTGLPSSTIEYLTRSVPADWHARVSAAFDLNERLLRTKLPGYVNSAVVPGSYDDGTARLSIGVRPDDVGTVPETIEDLTSALGAEWRGFVEDVDLSVERIDPIDEAPAAEEGEGAYLALDPTFDPVPGGVRCETGRRYATLAPALYHPNRSEPVFGTVLHAFPGDTEFQGTSIDVPIEGHMEAEPIATATTALDESDFAIATPVDGHTPGSMLGRRGELPVRGQLTRWGLADRVARGETLVKVGGTTGYTSGPIHGIDAATCVTTDGCRLGQVTWGSERTISDGDSGSVTVDPDPDGVDGALVASINSARTWWPGQNHSWGTAAYALTSASGYHF